MGGFLNGNVSWRGLFDVCVSLNLRLNIYVECVTSSLKSMCKNENKALENGGWNACVMKGC